MQWYLSVRFHLVSDAYYIPHPSHPQFVTLTFDEVSIILVYNFTDSGSAALLVAPSVPSLSLPAQYFVLIISHNISHLHPEIHLKREILKCVLQCDKLRDEKTEQILQPLCIFSNNSKNF